MSAEQLAAGLADKRHQHPNVAITTWCAPPLPGQDPDEVAVTHLPDGRAVIMVVSACADGDPATVLLDRTAQELAGGRELPDLVHAGAEVRSTAALPACVLGVTFDPATRLALLANTGFPPALVVRANGEADWMGGKPHSPERRASPRQAVGSAILAPGDWLVTYSTALVDGPGDLMTAFGLLRSAAIARRRLPVSQWARGLAWAVAPEPASAAGAVVAALHCRLE